MSEIITIKKSGFSSPEPKAHTLSLQYPHAPSSVVVVVVFVVFIAPAYSRVQYRSSNPSVRTFVRSFVRSSVRSFVRQHLRRSLVFSTSVIAASLKACIVIVIDIPFKHAPRPSTLDLYFTVH